MTDNLPTGPKKLTKITKHTPDGRISEFETIEIPDPKAIAEAEAKAEGEEKNSLWEKHYRASQQTFDSLFDELKEKPKNAHNVTLTQAHYSALRQMGILALTMAKACAVDLHQRIKAVESKAAVAYRGVWSKDEQYIAGQFVTRSGSMWHANKDSKGVVPGDGNIWTLAVKSGKDGR